MIRIAPKLTEYGRSLIARGIAGELITFTRFEIGAGDAAGYDIENISGLFDPKLEFPVNEVIASDEGYVELKGFFDGQMITEDFVWSELGLYARGEDDEEQLYAYTCDTENAMRLRANTTDVIIEQALSVIVAIGDAQNVTAQITPSTMYASKESFDAHVNDFDNPHNVTAEMIGLGNVPNVPTNDQVVTYEEPQDANIEALVPGEILSSAFGKLARGILALIAHIAHRENPHKVTAAQAGAAEKDHSHNAADISEGVLGVENGGTGCKNNDELIVKLGSRPVIGVYTGNGNVKRHIDLGFRPSAVLLTDMHGIAGDDIFGVRGGLCVDGHGLIRADVNTASYTQTWNDNYTAMLIDDTGFFVSYKANSSSHSKIMTNMSGVTYRYIAFK